MYSFSCSNNQFIPKCSKLGDMNYLSKARFGYICILPSLSYVTGGQKLGLILPNHKTGEPYRAEGHSLRLPAETRGKGESLVSLADLGGSATVGVSLAFEGVLVGYGGECEGCLCGAESEVIFT